VCATARTASSGTPTTTSRVMISATARPNSRSSRAASRTMSRSETMPTGAPRSSTTTSAPMLCSARSPSASRMACSGRQVTTRPPLRARMLAMFISHLPGAAARLPRNGGGAARAPLPRGLGLLAQDVLLDLARRGLRQRPEDDGAGRLVVGEVLAAPGDDLLGGDRGSTRLERHERARRLPPARIGLGHHGGLHDRRVPVED